MSASDRARRLAECAWEELDRPRESPEAHISNMLTSIALSLAALAAIAVEDRQEAP